MKKLSIGSDVDDVLMNNSKGMRYIISDVIGREYTEPITDWHFNMFPKKQAEEISRRCYTGELHKWSTPIKNAVEVLKKLMQDGHEVYFVTAIKGEEVEQIRKNQILSLFGSTDNLIITRHKHIIKTDVLIDDGPHNISASPCDYKVIFEQDWNKQMDLTEYNENGKKAIRTGDWLEIYKFIEGLGNIK